MLGIRPEDFEITPEGATFAVRVVEPLGSHVLLTGEMAGQMIRVVVPPDCAAGGGDTLQIRPLSDRIRWMAAQDGQALEEVA
jgi:multiple sugar transport system ATP-binding protein